MSDSPSDEIPLAKPEEDPPGHGLRVILWIAIPPTVWLVYVLLPAIGPDAVARIAAGGGVIVTLIGWAAVSPLPVRLAKRTRLKNWHAGAASPKGQDILMGLGVPLLVVGTLLTFQS